MKNSVPLHNRYPNYIDSYEEGSYKSNPQMTLRFWYDMNNKTTNPRKKRTKMNWGCMTTDDLNGKIRRPI